MRGIKFVDDDELPEGHDFVFVQAREDWMVFLRESAITAPMLEDTWAALLALQETPPTQITLRSVS